MRKNIWLLSSFVLVSLSCRTGQKNEPSSVKSIIGNDDRVESNDYENSIGLLIADETISCNAFFVGSGKVFTANHCLKHQNSTKQPTSFALLLKNGKRYNLTLSKNYENADVAEFAVENPVGLKALSKGTFDRSKQAEVFSLNVASPAEEDSLNATKILSEHAKDKQEIEDIKNSIRFNTMEHTNTEQNSILGEFKAPDPTEARNPDKLVRTPPPKINDINTSMMKSSCNIGKDFKDTKAFTYSCDTVQGNSGSPVIQEGQVVGLHIGTSKEGDTNIAVSLNQLTEVKMIPSDYKAEGRSTYTFNKYSSDVWIAWVTMTNGTFRQRYCKSMIANISSDSYCDRDGWGYRNEQGIVMKASISTPRCSVGYRLNGYIKFKWTGRNGAWMERIQKFHSGSANKWLTPSWFHPGYFPDTGGNMSYQVKTECILNGTGGIGGIGGGIKWPPW